MYTYFSFAAHSEKATSKSTVRPTHIALPAAPIIEDSADEESDNSIDYDVPYGPSKPSALTLPRQVPQRSSPSGSGGCPAPPSSSPRGTSGKCWFSISKPHKGVD